MAVASALAMRYRACMVLSGVGDALGYKNGNWEFCRSGRAIHDELNSLGGVAKITVQCPGWTVSDDTVMHLATAEALMAKSAAPADKEALYSEILNHYKKSFNDMAGRAPGDTCAIVKIMHPDRPKGYQIDFNPRGGGCGASMRSMCIGLRYPRPEDLADLIAVSVESGRMTHHHPTGYLGGVAGALFTAYAIQGKPLKSWGHDLVNTLPQVLDYVRSQKYFVRENEDAWSYFSDKWKSYLEYRGLTDGQSDATFTEADGNIEARDKLYKSWSFSGWAGSSGHDAPMIAYDALQASGTNWPELCSRSMFHSGDSDSTGVMAAAWFGALYGYADVPENNYKHVEYYDRLCKAADKLYELSQGEETNSEKSPQETA